MLPRPPSLSEHAWVDLIAPAGLSNNGTRRSVYNRLVPSRSSSLFDFSHYSFLGLTLIAGQLLLLAPEEDAFWIFISIMDAHIRPYFSSSPQIDVDSALFSRALENADPVVAKKVLMEMSISPNDICRPWYVISAFRPIRLTYLLRLGLLPCLLDAYHRNISIASGISSFSKVKFMICTELQHH